MHSAYGSKETLKLNTLDQKFQLLRLLNLWGIKTLTGALPTEIGRLIHLRYLGIRASNITDLPPSIGKLRNLLTLDYRNIDCSDKTVKIPNVLCKLMLLRHLFLPINCPWTLKELQLSTLKNLQILWGVKCGGGDWFSRVMLGLNPSLSKLKVVVSTEKNLEAVFDCQSLKSDRLHTFHCEWSVGVALKHVNNVISRNQHLRKLVLVVKIQVQKLSLILPSNLLALELKDSVLKNEDLMVVSGSLAHLKLLRLSNSYTGTTFTCNLGSFPQLEEIYLDDLQKLVMWKIKEGAMSSLKKLEILNCQKLQFPHGLVYFTTLQQLELFGLRLSLTTKVDYDGLPDWDSDTCTDNCEWTETEDRDALIKVVKPTSSASWLHVTGNFRLLSRRKLHLVLDLDHTLVHTRKTYKLSPEDRNFVRTRRYGIDYNLPGKLGTLFQAGGGWTKLRPYVRDFLREASTMFDMTIHTLGCKFYAWSMAKLLDPNGRYFENWRVISRDDCVALDKHKKFLDVVLEHERVVVVMDDNEDVWEDHKTNLLKITPYNYFSYFSPEDKVHDASPPRLSWSQLNGDESEENGVLARALDKLRLVHAAFFDDSAARIMETGM
uniref:RNA polymerase II C-terminal domain phosphatase-like n=1 Tax=Chenopodium quinoa TaxID=63459 RepID=A0A803MQM2_CHEQI